MVPRAPYFISKKVFGFVFRKKLCGTQKTGFSPKNRKNRFLGLLKAKSAGKMVFEGFWAENECFGVNIGDSENFLHFFSKKNFLGQKSHFFGLNRQKTCFFGPQKAFKRKISRKMDF